LTKAQEHRGSGDHKQWNWDQSHPVELGGIKVMSGKVACKAVAKAYGMEWRVVKPD